MLSSLLRDEPWRPRQQNTSREKEVESRGVEFDGGGWEGLGESTVSNYGLPKSKPRVE